MCGVFVMQYRKSGAYSRKALTTSSDNSFFDMRSNFCMETVGFPARTNNCSNTLCPSFSSSPVWTRTPSGPPTKTVVPFSFRGCILLIFAICLRFEATLLVSAILVKPCNKKRNRPPHSGRPVFCLIRDAYAAAERVLMISSATLRGTIS